MNPWTVELLIVRASTYAASEQRALARDVERGTKLRLRRGVYVASGDLQHLDGAARAVVGMRALDAVSEGPVVFSHWSAATLHALPFLSARTGRLDITDDQRSRPMEGVRLHRLPLDPRELTQVGGLWCTTPSRTVIDVAAATGFEEAVVVADAALRRLDVTAALLAAAVDLAGPRRAAAKIDSVLRFADGAGESPGESVSRVTMHRLGLPAPVLQHVFVDANGRFLARLDFWFPEQRVAGEMDGRAQYLDPAMNDGDAARAVYEEKLREDRVRAQDVRFARWGWTEARSPVLLGRRLADAGVHPVRLMRA